MGTPKLLTPISHLFLEKNSDAEISQISDALEARERTADLRLPKTSHYHIDFDLNLGLTAKQIDFLCKQVKPRSDITHITFQMSRDCEVAKIHEGQYQLSSRRLSEVEQIDNVKMSLKTIKNIVGTEKTIGVENNNYYPTGAYDICTASEFIVKVLEESGLSLLFDYAHAKVSAINMQKSFALYSSQLLETHRCNQIHFCEHKISERDGGQYIAIDAHELPSDDTTRQVLEFAKKYQVPCLTVEYYKNSDKLVEYLSNLKSIL